MYIEDYKEAENGRFEEVAEEDREVFIDRSQMSIYELHRRYGRGDIELRPFYQRKDVWTFTKKSKLIESVLRNIPIPAIYLSEKEDCSWEVIDGQQRLNTFFQFLEDKYALCQVPVLTKLNDKHFNELDTKLQRKIEDFQVYIFIIKRESHKDIKFDIFERINEGASQLNAQELRNCIFRGEGIQLIKRLNSDKNFKMVIAKKLQTTRGKDEEIVLRFVSFFTKGYKSYMGNLNVFLNDTLRNIHLYRDKLSNIEEIFSDTMKTIYAVFGEDAFIKEENNRKKINISIFDILTVSFAKSDRKKIIDNRDKIVNSFYNLIKDKEFYDSITSSTLTKKHVEFRFNKWFEIMKPYLEE